MDFVDRFLERRAEFRNRVKDEILQILITKTNKNWDYSDGYFICECPEKEMILIVKGDFEPYVFTTLAVLTRNGECYEMDADSADVAAELANEYINDQEESEE